MAAIYSMRHLTLSHKWFIQNLISRKNSTIAAASLIKDKLEQPSSTDLDLEWENAKPYEEIPGLKSLPVIGTGWVFLPIVGKTHKIHVLNLTQLK